MKNEVKNTAKSVKKSKNKKIGIALVIAAIVLLLIWILLVSVYAILKNGEYLADWDAIREYDAVDGEYSMTTPDNGDTLCFVPDQIKVGLIFYQDELVENSAYIPLMRKLANSGVLCIVPTMPLKLSNLNKDAADDLKKEMKAQTKELKAIREALKELNETLQAFSQNSSEDASE